MSVVVVLAVVNQMGSAEGGDPPTNRRQGFMETHVHPVEPIQAQFMIAASF